jgi:hypothetical protein
LCAKEFALEPGMLAPKRETDTRGRRNHYRIEQEHEYRLPDPAEEATELLKLVEIGNCDPREIRELISYSPIEKRCLEFLESRGMVANVAGILSFRDDVLAQFNRLIDTEMFSMCERMKGKPVTNAEVVEPVAEVVPPGE